MPLLRAKKTPKLDRLEKPLYGRTNVEAHSRQKEISDTDLGFSD